MLAMTTPSFSWDAIFRVSSVAPDASFDARDLRFDQQAHTVAVFFVERISAFVLDVSDGLVTPAPDSASVRSLQLLLPSSTRLRRIVAHAYRGT
jgi:hypothetical protein